MWHVRAERLCSSSLSQRKRKLSKNCFWEKTAGTQSPSRGRLDKIKTLPVAGVTHYAPVEWIERYGEGEKYKVIFSEKAKPLNQIPFGDAPRAAIMGPRYTTLAQLMTGKKLTDLIGK